MGEGWKGSRNKGLTSKKFRTTNKVVSILNNAAVDLSTPLNLSSWWNFGSCLGLALFLQLVSGLLLSMHYSNTMDTSFDSVSHILRDVRGGWFLRSLHANTASFFFIALYAHVGRGLYYGSYIYFGVWSFGIFLMLLVMAASFLGYVLPWGQISFWGATVITNLFSAIPYFGSSIVT